MARKSKLEQGIGDMAAGIAQVVFSPDYYKGPWWVQIQVSGTLYKRECTSYNNAKAWAGYFQRKGYCVAGHNIAIGKVF